MENVEFGDLGCQKSWILASHYPDIKGWDFLLVAYAKSTSKNVKVEMAKTGWGSVLIRLER